MTKVPVFLKLSNQIWKTGQEIENQIRPMRQFIREKTEPNHFKVLNSFQKNRVNDNHFGESTGYGYGDMGRDYLDKLYATIFNTEAALVRPHIVSGTHAISLCLFGILRPGDELLSVTGRPYDTLAKVIGQSQQHDGSLIDWGIKYNSVSLQKDGSPDFEVIRKSITAQTKMIMIQRSRGYSLRPSLNIATIKQLITVAKTANPKLICFVDNCYGEFVEELEPTEVGADLMAGSLIKNPGGGVAPAGGYIVGKASLVQLVSNRLTAPGLGAEVGASLSNKRLFYQGLFMAPFVVSEALQGAVFTAKLFSELGFKVSPGWEEPRTDIIQAITLQNPKNLIAFCQGLQQGSPVDAHMIPEPALMPGYTDQIIMAGGTFVQGSSIELSADAPLREPYTVFLQGGLAYPYIKAAVLMALEKMVKQKLLSI